MKSLVQADDSGLAAFERLPGESSPAFAAFGIYRDLGPQRSLRAVGRKLGKSGSLIERWSSRWMWCTRAAAYDAYLDDERRTGAREEALAMGHRHAVLARLMQAKVLEGLLRLDTNGLPASSLARLLDVACRIERDALELSSLPAESATVRASDLPVEVRVRFTEDWPERVGGSRA
jgi:hypothetical protein